jgi:PAS domain S-box-containing protein
MTLYPADGLKHFWRMPIDEDLSFEELLAEISARLVSLPADQVDRGIEEALRLICNSAGIDESTIYLREIEDPDIFALSYVLRDPVLPPPPKIKFTAADNFPWCNKKLIANEVIYLPDTQAAPEEAAVDKASWIKYNVVSALVIPLSTGGGRPLGFWGIDSISERREWPERLQKRLRIIAGVFADTIDRAVSDRHLRESEARLTLAAETTGVGFWTIDVETGVIWATPKLKELFGLEPDSLVDMTTFLNIVHAEDRESMKQAIGAMTRGEERKVEYRIVPAGGAVRWVMSSGSCHKFAADGRSLLMGITLDVTERRNSEEALRTLGSRLLEAQEQERKRIARELHDGISQQLALIAVGLQQLKSEPTERLKRIATLSEETTRLASEVQALSHQLHSSKLDYLGLVPAIRGLCREISEHQQAVVHFTDSNIPKCVPPDVALALFRITQESLHNSLKYSGVRDFSVRLEGIGTYIELMISDRGVGFDVSAAQQGSGLGLISMRERILAVKGTLCIESQPLKGTDVRVRVPLDSAKCAA